MNMKKFLLISFMFLLAAPALAQEMSAQTGFGPDPYLPEPETSLVPTVNTAKAIGWPEGKLPAAAPGLKVTAFARNFDHPRWMYVLPNGDVLVAETNAPPKDQGGVKNWVMGKVMQHAGAKTQSANRIILLRDANGDGKAETRTIFLKGLFSPFGMALVGDDFYVANADAVMVFPYEEGQTTITTPGRQLVNLPAGINHHWTKNLIASVDGKHLYVSVGSNSNVAEKGMEIEKDRAAIHEIDRATGKMRLFASGLRNPVGMAWNPENKALWTVVNERDELGNDLVPDYMTSVKDGGFYGWPYSYYGQHVDDRVQPQNPDLVASALKPDYALGSHTASLGLTFYDGSMLPQYKNGALIGQHGSWNRDPRAGYKVIYVPFENGQATGMPQDVLSGFLSDDGDAMGRPVGVSVAKDGAILVADDVGNVIWRVSKQ